MEVPDEFLVTSLGELVDKALADAEAAEEKGYTALAELMFQEALVDDQLQAGLKTAMAWKPTKI